MEPELELIGRHAMLFDDDANASFVNSKDALVEWNSLFIDRYDVRHLLSNPPPSFRNFCHGSSSTASLPVDSHLESQLDLERYADLPSSSSEDEETQTEVEEKDTAGYNAVPFSYGNSADSTEKRNSDMAMGISAFRPAFPVPESLLQNLPSTEKLHQIIARTAIFVGEHGGQSEIVLRVKQGDNPTFGFLMPHHHLHPYFRYLVDHPELLRADNNVKSQDEKTNDNQTSGGALSLLGSVYGSGEDEDVAAEVDREPTQIDSGETSATKADQLEQMVNSGVQKDDNISKLSHPSKVKSLALSKSRISNIKPGYANGMRKDGDILGSTSLDVDKPKASSLVPIKKVETLVVDPPSDVKRLVDRIAEVILKNGKDFEAVLIEQDKKHEKFPFLLPSNQYHLYYLNVLKKAQESRLSGKSFGSEKDGSAWQETDRKTALVEENDSSSLGCGAHDLPLDYDRKEKFKMVIKSKKDPEDQPSKEARQQCGVSMDAASAAAILQAATRGIKKPNLDIFSKTSLNGTNHGSRNDDAQASSLQTSQTHSSAKKQSETQKPSVTVAKDIAKTAALAAASEADSSEAGLTREQKLKAERLRRAKMFAAMIKSGAAPLGKEPHRALSVEPPGSGVSGSATNIVNEEVKEREGSTVAIEAGTSDMKDKVERKSSDDENEHKSRKKRHYRSRKHDNSEGEEDEDEAKREEDEDEDDNEEDRRHSRKKHRSHRSSRHHRDRSKDRHKHRKRHSSSKSKESRHRHKHESSEDDDRYHRHRHDNLSEDEDKHHKRRHNHDSSSEDELKHSKRKHKRSRKDAERHERRSRKDERSHEELELEEGEIRTKSSDQSPSTVGDDACREAVVDDPKSSYEGDRAPSLPPSETTEVPDELRAKIRAMLLATM